MSQVIRNWSRKCYPGFQGWRISLINHEVKSLKSFRHAGSFVSSLGLWANALKGTHFLTHQIWIYSCYNFSSFFFFLLSTMNNLTTWLHYNTESFYPALHYPSALCHRSYSLFGHFFCKYTPNPHCTIRLNNRQAQLVTSWWTQWRILAANEPDISLRRGDQNQSKKVSENRTQMARNTSNER